MDLDPAGVDAKLEAHLTGFFAGHPAERAVWTTGPMHRVMPRFHALRFAPGPRTGLWTYCSVGAWQIAGAAESRPLEFLMVSERETPRILELVTMLAYYHRDFGLGKGHTLGLGEPWLPGSSCDSILISTPYPFGPDLEVCSLGAEHVHFLWALPIAKPERQFKVDEGLEALEQRFEDAHLEYWSVGRSSVV